MSHTYGGEEKTGRVESRARQRCRVGLSSRGREELFNAVDVGTIRARLLTGKGSVAYELGWEYQKSVYVYLRPKPSPL